MTNLKNQVAKCIRYASTPSIRAFRHAVTAALLTSVLLMQTGGALAQPIILLSDDMTARDISASSLMWLDAQGSSTASQVAARSGSGFAPSTAEAVYSLGPKAALWQHYRFTVQAKSHEQWVLEFPQPLLDRITVYQSSAGSKWTSLTAGDTVPVADWPAPGR